MEGIHLWIPIRVTPAATSNTETTIQRSKPHCDGQGRHRRQPTEEEGFVLEVDHPGSPISGPPDRSGESEGSSRSATDYADAGV
jgi:hypothetical protein